MKFRLKATAQDWLIFGLFSVLLLIVVSILVNNIQSFSINGTFAGINPFPALFNNFAAVLILYLAVMAFLFYSVKDYFFDKESGFGFSFGKKDSKGFSDWCSDKEMKATLSEVAVRDPVYQHAGFPIISNKQKMWVDDGESHNIVIGSTGTGKTQCVIHPLVKILAKKGESMIVTDPKGEIYRESAGLLKQQGYQIIVLNFRDPQRGNTWNPLNLPYKLYKQGDTDKSMELLDDLATNILYDDQSAKQDPFWEKTSADYFAGLALGLFEDAKEEEVNINSISLMTSMGEEKFGARSTYIKEYFNTKDPAGSAYTCASGTIFAPEDTKNSILSTFRQKIRLFASRENLSEMLSQNDFDIDSIGRQKTAVFMIIHDEKKTYHALATIFIKQCYESLIDVAQHSPKGELPIRTNFILDEFQNMPPLKDITTMVAAARSRHIRLTMIIQNFAGLEATYTREIAQTIRSNCNNLLYLLTTELAALKEISELCGDKMVKIGKGEKEREEARPLATVADLQKMKLFEAIVIRTRLNPYKTKLTPNFELDWGIPPLQADEFIEREKKPIQVFDLKKFMQEKKKDNLNNMLNGGMPSMMPGVSPSVAPPLNPFESLINNGPSINNQVPNQNNMPNLNPTPNPQNSASSINVDDLIKKIDAKIEELEREEELERQKQKGIITKPKEEVSNIAPTIITGFKQEEKTPNVLETVKPEAMTNANPEPIQRTAVPENSEVSNSTITDDQFFDDFFDE